MTPKPKKPADAKTHECWCQGDCPHLKKNNHCKIFGELDYCDGPLAACLIEEETSNEPKE